MLPNLCSAWLAGVKTNSTYKGYASCSAAVSFLPFPFPAFFSYKKGMKKHTRRLSCSTTTSWKEEAVPLTMTPFPYSKGNSAPAGRRMQLCVSLLGLQTRIFFPEFYPQVYVSSLFILKFWSSSSTSGKRKRINRKPHK